jgi:hypothetical protein
MNIKRLNHLRAAVVCLKGAINNSEEFKGNLKGTNFSDFRSLCDALYIYYAISGIINKVDSVT